MASMPRRWPVLTAALAAALLAIALVPVVASLAVTVRGWWWAGDAWWSAPAPFFGPHEPLAWIVGGLVPAAAFAGAIARWADRRALRLAAGVWGLVQIVFGGLTVIAWEQTRRWEGEPPFPVLDVVGFGLAGLAAIVIAAGFVVCARTRREIVATAVVAIVLAAAGSAPSIARAVDDARAQDLPSFRFELVAVELVGEHQVVDASQPVLEHAGAQYHVRTDDVLALTDADVQRVRWEPDADGAPAFTVVFRGPAGASVRERSLRRLDREDALRIDGRVVGVAMYRGWLLDGAMNYGGGDRPDEVRAIFRALTGLEPPG